MSSPRPTGGHDQLPQVVALQRVDDLGGVGGHVVDRHLDLLALARAVLAPLARALPGQQRVGQVRLPADPQRAAGPPQLEVVRVPERVDDLEAERLGQREAGELRGNHHRVGRPVEVLELDLHAPGIGACRPHRAFRRAGPAIRQPLPHALLPPDRASAGSSQRSPPGESPSRPRAECDPRVTYRSAVFDSSPTG